jgi:glycosyltransferase involved in cell wall biosynthesis
MDRGGAEKQLVLLARGLPREEFDVHVALLTRGGPREKDVTAAGIPVHRIDKKFKIDPLAYRRLSRLIGKLEPDLVQTWLFAANAYGRAAAIANRVPHVIGSERSVDPWKRGYELAIDRNLAKRSDCIVVNSLGTQAFYEKAGIPRGKFRVIPNGVEPFVAADGSSREELLKSLGLPEGARLIGAIGRLWPQKRVKDLIWATELLNNVHKNAYLLVIGDGPQRRSLERYRFLVRIEENVRFLGERNDVPAILPHLDMVCLASSYEGQSNAVMEAMSAGLPVVASDIPGNRELIVEGVTGFLVPVGDRGEFARRMNRLLGDPDLARSMGAAGCARMCEEFSVPKMVERYATLYREVIGR